MHMEAMLTQHHVTYQRWPAVYVEDPSKWELHESIRHYTGKLLKGTIGCMLSHLQVLKHIASLDSDELYVILEDDVCLFEGFEEAVHDMQPPKYCDIVLVDCWGPRDDSKLIAPDWYDTNESWPNFGGTHCVIVNGSAGASAVLKDLEGAAYQNIDGLMIGSVRNKLIWTPKIVYIKEFASDRTGEDTI